jgi:PKHD-type hydroxylase
LNDPKEFKGGDFQLMVDSDTPVTVEQKKGRAWFFPSYTLHRVTPVTEGERKSLVLWIGGPAFR